MVVVDNRDPERKLSLRILMVGRKERKQWVYEEGGLNWSPFTNSGQDLRISLKM